MNSVSLSGLRIGLLWLVFAICAVSCTDAGTSGQPEVSLSPDSLQAEEPTTAVQTPQAELNAATPIKCTVWPDTGDGVPVWSLVTASLEGPSDFRDSIEQVEFRFGGWTETTTELSASWEFRDFDTYPISATWATSLGATGSAECGAMPVGPSPFVPREFVGMTASEAAFEAEARGIEYRIVPTDDFPPNSSGDFNPERLTLAVDVDLIVNATIR